MKKSQVKIAAMWILLIVLNGLLFLLYPHFNMKFILAAIFPNVAIIYGYLLDKKFIKNSPNKILAGVWIYGYFLVSAGVAAAALAFQPKAIITFSVQGVLFLISLLVYFYLLSNAKHSVQLQQTDKRNIVDYKALEIDLQTIKGRGADIDREIDRLIEGLRFSPKNSNAATSAIDTKMRAAVDVLLEESVSNEDLLEAIHLIKKLLKEKNDILKLSN